MKKTMVITICCAALGVLAAPGLIALLVVTSLGSASASCIAEAGTVNVKQLLADLPKKVGVWQGEQVLNAAYIIKAGQAMDLDAKSITIGVMTAMGESSLINVDYGDQAGPDSRGLFQQRANGAWGTLADRMNPTIAATNFFKALRKVPGYLRLEPTIAAHRTQRNADPFHYRPFWADAVSMVSTLTDDPDLDSLLDPSATPPSEPTGDDTLVWPVGKDVRRGAEYNQPGAAWSSGFHTGTDFNPGAGTPIHAAHAGTVTESTDSGGAYGRTVVITWKQDTETWANRYAHLLVRTVDVGDQVTAGDVIGKVGWSGNVRPYGPAGAHLHFELLINGRHTDPLAWLQGKAVDPKPGVGAAGQPCPPQTPDIPAVNREANAAAVRFALSQIGQPYATSGGTGPAYGCNGFAWRAWKEAGSEWPLMLADEQGTTGRWVTEIPQDEAQPGDLVVFWYANGTDTSAGVRWDHVGIVLDPVKGTYVNASNSQPYPKGGVKISNWNDYTGPRMGFTRVAMT